MVRDAKERFLAKAEPIVPWVRVLGTRPGSKGQAPQGSCHSGEERSAAGPGLGCCDPDRREL